MATAGACGPAQGDTEVEPVAAAALPAPEPGGPGFLARAIAASALETRREAPPRKTIRVGADAAGLDVLRTLLEPRFEQRQPDLDIAPRVEADEPLVRNLLGHRLDAVLTTLPPAHTWRRRGIEAHALVHVATAVVVHPLNPLFDVTKARLAGILSGQLRSWGDLTRSTAAIDVVGDGAGDAFQEAAMRHFFGGVTLHARVVEPTPDRILARVAKTPTAIGLVPLRCVRSRDVRVLSIDGVYATPYHVRSGKYPLTWTLYLLTRERPDVDVLRFVGFAKGGEARAALREVGVPAN